MNEHCVLALLEAEWAMASCTVLLLNVWGQRKQCCSQQGYVDNSGQRLLQQQGWVKPVSRLVVCTVRIVW